MTMRQVTIDSYDALVECLESFGPGALFRGQSKAYPLDNGGHSFLTTFDRHGCHPPRMRKWQHYASEILQAFVKGTDGTWDAATDQAILQHYGWRSFFLDATSEVAVGAWFAGHKYVEDPEPVIHASEDCFELPVITLHRRARYEPAEGRTVLYAFSRRALRSQNLGPVDLVEIATAHGRPRFLEQSAFMVGPLKGNLPANCILGCVTAPAELFRQYAVAHGFDSTQKLFPGPSEDPVLAALYSLPWEKPTLKDRELNFPMFRRSLQLPEYELQYVKWHPTTTAFYSRQWLSNVEGETGLDLLDQEARQHFLASELVFLNPKTDPPGPLPNVLALFEKSPVVVLESDQLLPHPGADGWNLYGKGLLLAVFDHDGKNVLLITELVVSHPGTVMTGAGVTQGKFYEIADGHLLRQVAHPDECDCGSDILHQGHLNLLGRLEELLTEGSFKHIGGHVFAQEGIEVSNDSSARFEKHQRS